MAEIAMLTDIQRKITRRLHVMTQARESSPVTDILTTVLYENNEMKKRIGNTDKRCVRVVKKLLKYYIK